MNEKIKVSCMGDSLTWGDHATNPEFCSYPAVIKRIAGDRYEVKNFSKCGAFAHLIEGDAHSYYYLDIMKKARDFAPDAVLLMLGSNDANPYWRVDETTRAEEYVKGMKKIISALSALENLPKIFICTSPWIANRECGFVRNLDKLVKIQRDLAEEYGFDVIDTREFTAGKYELYAEGLHLCDYGYKCLAKFILEKLDAFYL
ncbi:MAG: hypothetical protein J5922_01690 [Clostridia bacterium]|nr:hypothetical protein [Clostridia bacterium]